MEIVGSTYYENLKRYWRRKSYQRLNNGITNTRKKLKIMRLGGGGNSTSRRFWRIRAIPKLRFRILSPSKLLEKLHDAYVHVMIRWAGNSSVSGGKKVPKGGQLTMVSNNFEQVDARMVLEIYKRMVSTRELAIY